jgi:hypothetical protein
VRRLRIGYCVIPPFPVIRRLKSLKSIAFVGCRDIPVDLKDLDHLKTISFENCFEDPSALLRFFSGS